MMAAETSSTSTTPHIVLFALEAWGHNRPLCNLAAIFVQKRRVNVTFITSPAMFDRVNGELSRCLPSSTPGRDLLRVVGVESTGEFVIGSDASFGKAYAKLAASKALQCVVTNTTGTPLPAPHAIVLDFFALDGLRTIRKLTPDVKVFAWQTGSPIAVLRKFGPVELGGEDNPLACYDKIATEHGISPGQALSKYIEELPGHVVKAPSLPDQYDYEFHPYPTPPPMVDLMVKLEFRGFHFFNECDGVIQSTDVSVESEALRALDVWMGKTGRKVYNIGPVLPKGEAAKSNEVEQSIGGEAVTAYLEESFAKHGPASVFYISFGSVWGPWDNPEKLWLLLDVLIENKVPFIFAHGSPMAVIPEEIKQKVEGHGVLSAWAPQQAILDHPATGWVLTHGGQNSVLEALDAGIPMVIWPFQADQPINAAHLTDTLAVSYQLFEVRAPPHGLKKSLRTGRTPTGTNEAARAEFEELVRDMRSEDGAKRRANAKRVQEELRASLQEGGSANLALEQLMDDMKL